MILSQYSSIIITRGDTLKKDKQKKKPLLFRFFVGIVRIFYRKRKIIGAENLPKAPSLIISNHAQMHGPVSNELFFPTNKRIWCIGQMMNLKETPEYAYQDFWSKKPKCTKWFYKIVAYIMAPLLYYLMSRADTIAVYKDSRIITTFKHTVESLNDGNHIIIFPECPTEYNEIINEFQDKYIDVARLYYKRYNRELEFVPMYNSPTLKTMILGNPIKFDHNMDMEEQRKVINNHLKSEITRLAKELSPHKVVPYANVSKRKYPMSK